MQRGEAEFTTKVQKWIKHNWKYSGPWEIKVSYAPLLNYKSAIKKHKIPNLLTTCQKDICQTYKISDLDQMQKPWDIDVYHNAKPMLCFNWIGNKTFYLISPELIKSEIESGSKSLTEKRAEELAFLISEVI